VAAAHWIKSAVLAAAAATAVLLGPAPHAFAQPTAGNGALTASDAGAVQRDLDLQLQILLDPNASPIQREEAARKLVSRDADAVVLRLLLQGGGSRDVQLAVAKALQGDPTPNASFLEPLGRLLGEDSALTDAAAQAMATFREDDRVLERMMTFVRNLNNNLTSRRFVVRAMGELVDQRAARVLIDLLNQPNENELLRDAAAGALEQMTGQSFGTDPQRWNQWWTRARNWTPDEWALSIARVSAAQADNRGGRLETLRDSTYKRESTRYRELFPKDPNLAAAELLKLMTDPSEDVRTVAVQIVYDDAGRVPAPAVAEQLRKMVGDSSALVRERVALTLGAINDPAAVDALLTQAAQEREPDVLAAIIGALGPASQLRGDFATVEPLLSASLNHESFKVSRAAAEALKSLAGLLRDPKNKAAADAVAARLQTRLRGTGGNVAASKLRESIVESLADLAHPSSAANFQQLLSSVNENPIVRIAALRGLRNIGDPNTAQSIVNVLSNDPDRGVRLEAAQALLTTAQYANIQQIYPRLNESIEIVPRSTSIRRVRILRTPTTGIRRNRNS
jgi:HEAT repeat protein